MKMLSNLSVGTDFISIDVGSTSIRALELKGSSMPKSLARYAAAPIPDQISRSDAPEDRQKLASEIRKLLDDSGFKEENVVVGIPSGRVFATVVDFPKLPTKELHKTITYQLDNHIPSSIDEVKVDWSVLGDSPAGNDKVEVLIASVGNKFAEDRLDLFESIGLNVVALEPDALALVRSLVSYSYAGSALLLDIGSNATDLVVVDNQMPKLIRSLPIGGSNFVKSASQNLNVDDERANEFVYKFGLNTGKLEGQVARALQPTVDSLTSEVNKSIKFFSNRYKRERIDKIIVTGRASTIPNLALEIANATGTQVEIGNSWQNVNYPQSQLNQLQQIANHFTVAIGLSLRTEQ